MPTNNGANHGFKVAQNGVCNHPQYVQPNQPTQHVALRETFGLDQPTHPRTHQPNQPNQTQPTHPPTPPTPTHPQPISVERPDVSPRLVGQLEKLLGAMRCDLRASEAEVEDLETRHQASDGTACPGVGRAWGGGGWVGGRGWWVGWVMGRKGCIYKYLYIYIHILHSCFLLIYIYIYICIL